MAKIAEAQKIDVLISNHPSYDGSIGKLEALRKGAQPNPLLLGTPTVVRGTHSHGRMRASPAGAVPDAAVAVPFRDSMFPSVEPEQQELGRSRISDVSNAVKRSRLLVEDGAKSQFRRRRSHMRPAVTFSRSSGPRGSSW